MGLLQRAGEDLAQSEGPESYSFGRLVGVLWVVG